MKTILGFILIILCSLSTQPLNAQWIQTNGPRGGTVVSMAITGKHLFAASVPKGIYVSSDNGSSWTLANSGLTNIEIHDFAISTNGNGDTNIYTGTYNGVALSTNFGSTWNSVNQNMEGTYVISLATLPNNNGNTDIIAGTSSNGIFISSNEGSTWVHADSGLENVSVWSLAVSGTRIFVGTDGEGIFRSSNKGSSWTQIKEGLTDSIVYKVAAFSDGSGGTNIFAGTKHGMFRSTNYGTNWTKINSGPGNIPVYSFVAFTDSMGEIKLLAGTSNGIFSSTDGGLNWISSGLLNTQINVLASSGTNIFAGTLNFGVFVSSNQGLNWTQVNFIDPTINFLAVSDANLLVSTSETGGFISSDNGSTWNSFGFKYNQVGPFAVAHTPTGTNILVEVYLVGVFRTTNDGLTWLEADKGISGAGFVSDFAVSGNNIFAGTEFNGVFLSTDNGSNWTSVSPFSNTGGITSIAVNDSNIFIGTENGVLKSTDMGLNWSETSLKNKNVHALVSYNKDIFAGDFSSVYSTVIEGVYHSTDNGSTWTQINIGLLGLYYTHAITALAILPDKTGKINVFAGTNGGGVYLLTNNETNWTDISDGLTDRYISSFGILGNNIFVATASDGVWKRPLTEIITSVKAPSSQIRDKFNLNQNYPNPFNPTTTIKYEIPKTVNVSLKVYDILGREVATLVNKEQKPGFYEIPFGNDELASGIYFYRLQAGDFMQTKKMILLK